MVDEQNKPPGSTSADASLLKAKTLFGDKREVRIEFQGEIYRLRITRNDKLILTK